MISLPKSYPLPPFYFLTHLHNESLAYIWHAPTPTKLEGLPGVLFVLPDSYVDPGNKDYGAELFVNGEIVQRSPERQRRVEPHHIVNDIYEYHIVNDNGEMLLLPGEGSLLQSSFALDGSC